VRVVDGGDKPGHEGKEHSELVIASVSEAIQRFVLSSWNASSRLLPAMTETIFV
jgi:hypothetical protein